MATKITILGSEATEKKELKKIEFVGAVHYTGKVIEDTSRNPSDFEYINVYLRTAKQEFDVFICYKDGIRFTYFGNFNDGVL